MDELFKSNTEYIGGAPKPRPKPVNRSFNQERLQISLLAPVAAEIVGVQETVDLLFSDKPDEEVLRILYEQCSVRKEQRVTND